jgi:hypothetical protein
MPPSILPILLFRSRSNRIQNIMPGVEIGEPLPGLLGDLTRIIEFPVSIFLRPAGIVLPYGIGANGYAGKSDGSRYENRRKGKRS